MDKNHPTSLGAVSKDRWSRAQRHEAGFWQQPGIVSDQLNRTRSRYEDLIRRLGASASPNTRILEVGSGPTCATRVFPHGRRVFLDPLMRTYRPLIPDGVSGGFVCAIGEQLPFADSQFDFTFSVNVLDHVIAPARFVAELVRVTRPAGKIVIGVYTHPRIVATARIWIDRLLPFFGEAAHPYFFSRNSLVRLLESQSLLLDELIRVHAPSRRPQLHRQGWVAVASRPA